MSRFALRRRTVLRGAGVALGLPLLEAMLERLPAYAQPARKPMRRLVVVGGATSTGSDDSQAGASAANLLGMTIPAAAGTMFPLPLAMTSLASIRNELSVLSGLRMTPGGNAAPAGASIGHDANMLAQLTGTRVDGTAVSSLTARAPTLDQLMIPVLDDGNLHPSLHLRVQRVPAAERATKYMSQRAVAGQGIQPVLPEVSPRALFRSLFGGLRPGTPQEQERTRLKRELDLHVVDSVRERTIALKKRLGRADAVRLDQHLHEIEDLERRIRGTPNLSGKCELPFDPGADPEVNESGTYAGESQRARTLIDLLHMAFVCDLSRVATLQLSVPEWDLSMAAALADDSMNVGNGSSGLHLSIHHGGNQGATTSHEREAKALRWHLDHYGYLVEKLAKTPDLTGATMLSQSAVVYVGEAGWSLANGSHAPENMLMLIAGKAGDLSPGSHLATNGANPGQALFATMRALGYQGASFGEITSELPGLRRNL
jgi:hypothetical protein